MHRPPNLICISNFTQSLLLRPARPLRRPFLDGSLLWILARARRHHGGQYLIWFDGFCENKSRTHSKHVFSENSQAPPDQVPAAVPF